MNTGTRYLAGLVRSWPILAVAALLGLLGGLLYALVATPDYRSSATVLVTVETSGTPTDRVQGADYLQQTLPTFADAVTSSTVLRPVLERLDLDLTVAELRQRLTVDSPADTALISIEAESSSASGARRLASAVTGEFVRTAPGLIAPTSDPASGDGTGVEVQLNGTPAVLGLAVVDAPAVPPGPESPSIPLGLALGLVAGLLLGIVVGLVRTALDRRVRDADEVALITGLPVLGTLPRLDDDLRLARPDDPEWQRAVRGLRTALLPRGENQRVVQFTAATKGEGTTTVVVESAEALALSGFRVTVVDGDLERGDAAALLEVDASVTSLVDAIRQAPSTRSVAAPVHGGLGVVPGRRDAGDLLVASDLLASDRAPEAVAAVSAGSDVVLIDTPSLEASADALALSRSAAEVALVVGLGVVTAPALESLLERMQAAGASVTGVVLIAAADRPVSPLALARWRRA